MRIAIAVVVVGTLGCAAPTPSDYGVTDRSKAVLVVRNRSPFELRSVRAIGLSPADSGLIEDPAPGLGRLVYVLPPGSYRVIIGYAERNASAYGRAARGAEEDTVSVAAAQVVECTLMGGDPTPTSTRAGGPKDAFRPPGLSVSQTSTSAPHPMSTADWLVVILLPAALVPFLVFAIRENRNQRT